MASDEWLVVSNSISVLVVLHEENMGNVKFPSFMLTAEFSRLSEDLLDLSVVSFIPVHFGLHHKYWNIEIKGGIILLESNSDGLGVSGDSCILN